MKIVHVACAVIVEGDRVLITRRPARAHLPHFWEFPGGKVENETIEEGLRREIEEELGVTIQINKKLQSFRHQYAEHTDQTLELHFFLCSILLGEPQALAATEMCWAPIKTLVQYEFPPADKLLLEQLPKLLA